MKPKRGKTQKKLYEKWQSWVVFISAIIVLLGAIAELPQKLADMYEMIFATQKPSLKDFSVEQPQNDDEIPLGINKSRILEGHFPVIETDDEMQKTARIEVEVYKLPGREELPQTGKSRISTIEGTWFFDSAKFTGEGLYEIVVSASLGNSTYYQRLKVKCTEKATFYRKYIDQDRKIRGVEEVQPPDLSEVSIHYLRSQLPQLQQDFFDFFNRNNMDKALATVLGTLDIVDRILPLFPNDLAIQNVRAYTFKNYAMIMKRLKRHDEFERALDEAYRTFEAIRDQNPEDAGAWNGLGSIYLLRRNPEKALPYINRALQIYPNYKAALIDKNTALKLLEAKNTAAGSMSKRGIQPND
jgi:tetratricopeptide (TPR) repeat protein